MLLANETNDVYKRNKSYKNKLFRKFKNTCFNLQKRSNLSNADDFLSAKQAYRNQLENYQKIHDKKKRMRSYQNSFQKKADIFNVLGKRGGRQIGQIHNPVNGRTTDDPVRITQIFTHHYSEKTNDPENDGDVPPSSFPDILDELLTEYDATLDDIFHPQIGQTSLAPFYITDREVLKGMKNKVASGPSKIFKHSLIFY